MVDEVQVEATFYGTKLVTVHEPIRAFEVMIRRDDRKRG